MSELPRRPPSEYETLDAMRAHRDSLVDAFMHWKARGLTWDQAQSLAAEHRNLCHEINKFREAIGGPARTFDDRLEEAIAYWKESMDL